MYFQAFLQLFSMKKITAYQILILIAAICISTLTNASEINELNAEKSCKQQDLQLGDNVEHVQWAPAIYGHFTGFVIYDDESVQRITGSFDGFCPLKSEPQSRSQNWLSHEERGGSSLAKKAPEESKFNDTNGGSPLGLENDKATFFGNLSNRTDEYQNDALGQDYHLKRLQMLMNISGTIRWIDQPNGRVFIPRTLRNHPIPCTKEICSWGHFVIEADVEKGPRIAVYGYYNRRLQLLAATPWHGNKDGWVTFVGVRDYDRDKRTEIVAIRDPQNEGALELWELLHKTSPSRTPYTLVKRDQKRGFSNHKFGTKSLQISTVIENGFTPINIVVPNSSKNTLQIMSIENDQLGKLGAITLPMQVAHDMTHVINVRKRTFPTKLIVPLSDNTIRLIPLSDMDIPKE